MYAVQQPLAGSAFTDVMGEPAWKSLPSWYLVATDDEALPPDAERQFARRMGATTVEVPSSHVADGLPPQGSRRAHRIGPGGLSARWLTTGARRCCSGLRTRQGISSRPGAAADMRSEVRTPMQLRTWRLAFSAARAVFRMNL